MTNVSTGQTRFYTPEPIVYAAASADRGVHSPPGPRARAARHRVNTIALGSAIAALLDDGNRWVTGQRIEASGVHP